MKRLTQGDVVGVVVLLAGALFFGALGVGVVTAKMTMEPALALLLQLFIGLLFGSLSLAALLSATRIALRGRSRVPPALLSRCLSCGEACAGDARCPRCGIGPHDRAAALSVGPAAWMDAGLVATGAASLVCLGFFVLIGPYVDGERRLWVLLAMFALSLVLLGVGMSGFVVSLAESLRHLAEGSKVDVVNPALAEWVVSGSGSMRHGRLARFDGRATHCAALRPAALPEDGYRHGADTRLAEVLATLSAAGVVELREEVVWSWSWRPSRSGGDEVERSARRDVIVCPVATQEGGDELATAVWRFAARFHHEPVSVAEFLDELGRNPTNREQLFEHAEALRASGVRVPPAVVGAVHAALASARAR